MNKTLKISFALKNTYRVNGILFSVKQIPLIKKMLPETVYKVRGLKIFANILAVIWEIISAFLWKFIYFLVMLSAARMVYTFVPESDMFLHQLVILTIIGAFVNTGMFNPTRDKYYAMISMRMDAREYTLVNYAYSISKVIVGFMLFSLIFGTSIGIPVWLCILIPFSVAGAKIAVAAWSLRDYEKRGSAYNENKLKKHFWIAMIVLLAAAYLLPVSGIILPGTVSAVILILFIAAGNIGARKIITFRYYRELNTELLSQIVSQMDVMKNARKGAADRAISSDTEVKSSRRGFEYLNEIFIKRHRRILWKASKMIAGIGAGAAAAVIIIMYMMPEIKGEINKIVMMWLPYFVFIMYAINRGTGFTQALFINCDRSLLTYSFFKQPGFILKLFRIRLREIIKINALPAVIIGIGLAVILYISGGTEDPVDYVVLVVSIICMSVFFSIHYLTIYYLLQPYNGETEIKSGTYRIIMIATYLVCFAMIYVKMPIMVFGIICIVFCIIYFAVACALVYRFAPATFRLRV